MLVLVELAIGLIVIAVAALILGVGIKLIKENSKSDSTKD